MVMVHADVHYLLTIIASPVQTDPHHTVITVVNTTSPS
jgi:hypothetical protein